MDDESIQLNLDDLITEMYAKQLVHDVKIQCLTDYLNAILKHICPDASDTKELRKIFDESLQERINSLKQDNPIINLILQRKILNELGDIPGIGISNE